jgi:ribose/xylose/arabinose/galactoside ABC-type transport system permease subunit
VVTLGTLNILRGVLMYITNGEPITNLRGNFTTFSRVKIFGEISMFTIIWIVVMILVYIFVYKMRLGRKIIAVGNNPMAAERIGISSQKIYVLVFVMMGIFSGLAASMQVSRLAFGHPISGNTYEMTLIAAAVIGGTVFTGGVASILGTFLGAVLLATVENALIFAKVSSYLQALITGIILIIAVVSSAARFRTKIKVEE